MASLEGGRRVASVRNGSIKGDSPCFSNRSDTFRREMQVVSVSGDPPFFFELLAVLPLYQLMHCRIST